MFEIALVNDWKEPKEIRGKHAIFYSKEYNGPFGKFGSQL